MYGEEIYVNPTEVKRYKVTPTKNRFIPDLLPNNGRIEEPGYYNLNIREVRRVINYGYLVEVDKEDDMTEEQKNRLFLVGTARIGQAGLVED